MVDRGELHRKRMKKLAEEVTVYPVSCERLAMGRTDEQWLDQVLLGGARIVQLRDKDSPDATLLDKARMFRRRTREAGALFIVNDRLDIALLSDADGIHLGQEDIPPREIAQLAPEMIIGISCNTEDQAQKLGNMEQRGMLPVSYYNIGPIYPTGTKDGLTSFLGLAAIERFSSFLSIPFTVMGGIKLHNVTELMARGARRIAVVTALTQAEDIAGETRRWIEKIKSQSGSST